MDYFEFDTNVSKKTRAMQQSAREFGMEIVRPAGIELDKVRDPADAIAQHPACGTSSENIESSVSINCCFPRHSAGNWEKYPPKPGD
jgi:hypothetical protein